jgi:pyruvate,orthophosphate dikinase
MATGSKGSKYVYSFGNKKAAGDGSMKPLLGGKGANLAEMTRIGLPVPPGFTISTEVCTYYYAHKRTYPKELQAQMQAGISNMEKIMQAQTLSDVSPQACMRGNWVLMIIPGGPII